MKKVLYLHGLESKQGGSKVDFLSSICLVSAPVLDYRDSACFQNIHDLVVTNSFDLIIGSSMGGYLGFLMGEIFETPTILFNPALHSRSFEPNNCFEPQLGHTSHYIILGGQDGAIDPEITMKILQEIKPSSAKTIEIETIPEMRHRTPLDVFIAKIQPRL